MELDEIKKVIDTLDRGTSKENAAVRLDTCDPGDLFVMATQNGYLRLGVELLKAAFEQRAAGDNDAKSQFIEVDTAYLISKDSSLDFSSFERVDALVEESQEESISESLIMYLVLAVLISILLLAVIGLISIVRLVFWT